MAYDEKLAARVRKALDDHGPVVEKKMFGGLCFMLNGHMVAGVVRETLMMRVGPDNYEKVLKLNHAAEMDFTGRPMKGMVYVETEGVKTLTQVRKWLKHATGFVLTLKPK
ncbi:MAG: TfoX/Sxy family protein [Planctomycetota bacterium]|jgi:TfoX/Sxy family transcriptional regulator of competence genes